MDGTHIPNNLWTVKEKIGLRDDRVEDGEVYNWGRNGQLPNPWIEDEEDDTFAVEFSSCCITQHF
jgi:hypothetical protein